jgi:hypothetical protein
MKFHAIPCLLALFSLPALAAIDRKITVGGECTMEVEPDRGAVVLTAENQSPDAKTAIKKATELHERARSELKRSKLKGLEFSTVEYTVQEQFQWETNRQVSKGFVCRIGLRVVTPEIPALGEILSIAGDAGIRNTQGLQTYLSEQKQLEEKKKCLEGAAKNAREKAEHLAKSLGTKLGPVLQILERGGGGGFPGPVPVMSKMMGMAEADVSRSAAPTIEGQKQNLHLEVEVSFSLEP